MLELNTGRTGAKRQTLRAANPRDVLQRTIRLMPHASADEIMEQCWHSICDNSGMIRTMFEYWFANNFRSVTMPTPPSTTKSSDVQARTAAIVQQVKAKIAAEVKIALLNMAMPSGKTLADSTAEELQHLGGWALRVADRLQPGQTVAEAGLTEADLQTLYQG